MGADMKNRMKSTILFLFAVTSAGIVCAQNDLNRQVEVTRDYTPSVEKAVKLGIKPDLTDTVTLRPEIDYLTVRPMSFMSGLGVATINPIQVNMGGDYIKPKHFYLKAGYGIPSRSQLDLYGASVDNNRGYVGGYVNHTGQYSKLRNDLGDKLRADDLRASAGLFGGANFGRLALKGDVGYDYWKVNKYGMFEQPAFDPLADYGTNETQRYQTMRGKVSFGNDFLDTSNLNFRVGLGGYYFKDKYDFAEAGVNAFVELAKTFEFGELGFKAAYDGYYGKKELKNIHDYSNDIFTFSPKLHKAVDQADLQLGADFVIDDGDVWLFPQVKITIDLMNGYLTPYIDINGKLTNNGYRNTVLQNPYVRKGHTMDNSSEYNFNAGFYGHASSAFSYRVHVGLSTLRHFNLFFNEYAEGSTNEFFSMSDKGTRFNAGIEVGARFSRYFTGTVAANFYSYDLKKFDDPSGKPKTELIVGLHYNYKDKFTVDLTANALGKRYFYEYYTVVKGYNPDPVLPEMMNKTRSNSTFELNLEAAYSFTSFFRVFIAGRNLLDKNLRPYNHYRSVGINGTAGIVMMF